MKGVSSKLSSKFKSFFDKGEESPSKDESNDQADRGGSSLAFNPYDNYNI